MSGAVESVTCIPWKRSNEHRSFDLRKSAKEEKRKDVRRRLQQEAAMLVAEYSTNLVVLLFRSQIVKNEGPT